jgi:transcriptional regulator with GAF, ATPase, and Fis domain
MQILENFLSQLAVDERNILIDFAAFSDFFSIDWFPQFPPSKIMSLIRLLEKQQWITTRQEDIGYYTWSEKFPRSEVLDLIPSSTRPGHFRKSAEILSQKVAATDEITLTIARFYLLAGLREEDLHTILAAARIEEMNHRISSAVTLYDSILKFMEDLIGSEKIQLSEETWHTFIKSIEHRASLSLFYPSLKKIDRFLFTALDMARRFGDLRAQASLELLISQNCWMYFQRNQAIEHFNKGWDIIQNIEDEVLYKRGLKIRGLVYVIEGKYFDAIETYEQSLGELDSADNSDFFLLAALNLALCYTQVGIPQRGLGISESIQNQCRKSENLPLLSIALVVAGMIFLEIRQLRNSRSYFERAIEIARKESIPMVEVLASVGMAGIACQEGNYEDAAEYYKALWKIQKSSWYHILNYYPLWDTGYILHNKGASPIEMKPVFEFLYHLSDDEVDPLMYSMIQRLQLGLPENKTPIDEKIRFFTDTEKAVEKMGATFELGKIRIELARLFVQNNDWLNAEGYARKAWDFFKPIAEDCFPPDLKHFIPQNRTAKNDRLFDLVIEMGEALTNQENTEKLLTNIITSISRLTGSERSALFIKGEGATELNLVASRNLMKEEIQDERFKETWTAIQASANSTDGKIIQFEPSGADPVDLRRAIITPMKLGKRIIGVLYQDSRFFSFNTSPGNIKLLSAFASQISVSIDRAQAYDEIARLNKKLIQENLYYLEEKEEFRPFGEIIGSSIAVQNVQRLIRKVAPTQSTVLIQGETGVGKELVARAIHRESPRKNGAFIRVNCAALPETLIDSELFGHEKGAFTGAVKTKAGRFELAHNGTIFLDEVSELPPSTQSRLLRILQEKEFQRVGGTKILHSDFRLITATNKDLSRDVSDGKFRADLFYRLNVFPIYVPPLRERKEDIPLLAVHFLKLFSMGNKSYQGISESEMEKLQDYSWPGNIRELSNMIERAVILGGPKIKFLELEEKFLHKAADHRDLNLKDAEKRKILEALENTNGKIGGKDGASALLGLNRTTLIHRMKRLGIRVERSQVVQSHSK